MPHNICDWLARLSTAALLGALCHGASATPSAAVPHKIGLGKVLSVKGGVGGFDIDQNGNDGIVFTGNNKVNLVENFDEETGKITQSFALKGGQRNEYISWGIFGSDVGLIEHDIQMKGSIYYRRTYEVVNPITAGKITGPWTSPIKGPFDIIELAAENQTTSISVLFMLKDNLKTHTEKFDLIVTDLANNTVSKVIHLDPNYFGLEYGPRLGQYASANEAVIALSPDGGAVNGAPPINYLFDLTTGTSTQFDGYNGGPDTAGLVNDLATDVNTGVTATDTELNAQVEFYDMANQTGIAAVQLPCTGDTDQGSSGAGITADPVNKLFPVTVSYDACNNSQDGIIAVYDESGNYVETISEFNSFYIAEPAPAINPNKRLGWAYIKTSGGNELQQFFY
jgi:hypothetical protein